jgi:asparagine synthase (glutamine-hydrolysing)
MCGIAGICSLETPGRPSLDLIKAMTHILHHRGPDESGIFIDDWVALGHARLSIIDLAGGIQPIHNEDKNLWIIYNGEIFNYPELREDLEKSGHNFYTSTDTEVLLHLYEEKGASCLTYLNGQFAFAIWDVRKKELFLARDRVGIRPLFYTIQNNKILFASEIKSIFVDQTVPREIDPLAIHQIFTFWTTLTGKTVFKNIQELPPGHFLKISRSEKILQKYWQIPCYGPDEQIDWPVDQICEKVQELLTDAIRIRLRADVPVGCYLSGGLDSSVIAALIAKNFNNKVKTFGIKFEEAEYDEGEHQNQMVSFLKTPHKELYATDAKIGTSFPDVLWHCESPLLRTAPVPLFLLSELVNQSGFKVVLTGEGADEIFGGYNIFKEAKVRHFWAKQPDSQIRGLLIRKLYPYVFDDPRLGQILQSFFSSGLDRVNDPLFSHHVRWHNTSKLQNFLSEDVKGLIKDQDIYEELKQTLPESFGEWDYFSKAQYLEMSIFLSNYLLSSQGDRVAMGHSLEIRLPYLDYRLIDFISRVPSKWKIRGLNEKYILKRSFQNMLPSEIVNRTKHPYRAPIVKSLLNENTDNYIEEVLSERALKDVGLFNPLYVRKLLTKLQKTSSPNERENMALAGILSSQLIYEKFVSNFTNPSLHYPPSFITDKRTLNK